MSTQESTQHTTAESSSGIADLRVAMARLEEQLKAQAEDLSKQLAISQQLSTVQTQLGYFKITGVALGFILTIAAFFGVKNFNDVVNTATRGLYTRVEQNGDFAEGATLAQVHDYSDAIPHLVRSLEKDPYDEAILIQLLDAYAQTERWEESTNLVDRLQEDQRRFSGLRNPLTYNNMAASEIRHGLYDPKSLEQGYQHLKTALQLANQDDSELHGWIYLNFWDYWLVKGDLQQAKAYVTLLRPLPSRPSAPWNIVSKSRFFHMYLTDHPERAPALRTMWEEIRAGTRTAST